MLQYNNDLYLFYKYNLETDEIINTASQKTTIPPAVEIIIVIEFTQIKSDIAFSLATFEKHIARYRDAPREFSQNRTTMHLLYASRWTFKHLILHSTTAEYRRRIRDLRREYTW